MEPNIHHNLMDEFSQKPQKDFEKMFRNLIYLLFVTLLLCVVVSLGFFLNIYPGECAGKPESSTPLLNDSHLFNSMKPAPLDYIWPDSVEKVVNDILDNYMNVTIDERAVLIKAELMRFKTNDAFYIMVYDHTRNPYYHAFHGNQSEYITVIKPGKSNVVVNRSRYWGESPKEAFTTMASEVKDACSKGIASNTENYTDILKELYKNFHDINFLGIIDTELEVSIKSANLFGRRRGPGYWNIMYVYDPKTKKATEKKFVLIAGYK
ncbi:unnamed protein product [Caenorhabditis brenneri]